MKIFFESPFCRSWAARLAIGFIIAGLLAACAPNQPPETPEPAATLAPAAPTSLPATALPAPTPEPIATPVPDFLALPTLARGYLTTPNELRRIAALARLKREPYQIALKQELAYAESALDNWNEDIPNTLKFSDDIEKPKYLSVGAKYVYAWAIAYNLLRDSDPQQAERYARRARDLIIGMPEQGTRVQNYENNTRLNLSVYIQDFVYAADLLADWTPADQNEAFAKSADARKFKEWLGAEIIRYPYNAAHTRVNNWSAWARLTTAVIADYVGDAAPLYVQGMSKDTYGAYQVDPNSPCDPGKIQTCLKLDAHTMYSDAIQLHVDMVDGKLYEFSFSSCDASGSKSMIRPDGGIPDELRRQYDCDTTTIEDPYGAAARYSQFAVEAMVSLAELAWRRGDASIYTHIDSATGRGALWRAVEFLIDNKVTLTRGSMLEMVNRFYTYQAGVERDAARRAEYQKLLSHDLPGILKRHGDWPEGATFVSFGTLTHGFAEGDVLQPPPSVPAR
ncbi:MAG TPA: alginate lyase family protein [Roseiflexaceae bacterium]|nr:alginate lyase family protein [Roseiflexaceae bacterium]